MLLSPTMLYTSVMMHMRVRWCLDQCDDHERLNARLEALPADPGAIIITDGKRLSGTITAGAHIQAKKFRRPQIAFARTRNESLTDIDLNQLESPFLRG